MYLPLFLLQLIQGCWSGLINVTIDDTTTGIPLKYAPVGGWEAIPQGDTSMYDIDYTLVNNRTLHSGPWPDGNLTISFIGTMIYAFFVLDAGWNMDMLFYIDGAAQASGSFHRPADRSSDVYLYNQLVFQSDALDTGGHQLRIEVSRVPRIFFDYAIFTVDDGIAAGKRPTTSPAGETATDSAVDTPSGTSRTETPASTSAPGTAVRPQSGAPLGLSSAVTPIHRPSARESQPSDDGQASAHSASKLGEIVGGAVAGAVLVATVCLCSLRRKIRRNDRLVPWPVTAEEVAFPVERMRSTLEDSRAEVKGAREGDSHADNGQGRTSVGHAEPPPPPYSYGERGE